MIFRENFPESLVPKALNRKIVVEITVGSYTPSLDLLWRSYFLPPPFVGKDGRREGLLIDAIPLSYILIYHPGQTNIKHLLCYNISNHNWGATLFMRPASTKWVGMIQQPELKLGNLQHSAGKPPYKTI